MTAEERAQEANKAADAVAADAAAIGQELRDAHAVLDEARRRVRELEAPDSPS